MRSQNIIGMGHVYSSHLHLHINDICKYIIHVHAHTHTHTCICIYIVCIYIYTYTYRDAYTYANNYKYIHISFVHGNISIHANQGYFLTCTDWRRHKRGSNHILYIYTYMCIYICTHLHMYMNIYICIYMIFIYMHIICIIYNLIYICIYILWSYMYIYIYMNTVYMHKHSVYNILTAPSSNGTSGGRPSSCHHRWQRSPAISWGEATWLFNIAMV